MPNDMVISALQEQLVCYQRLAKLAEQQHEHVRQSRTEQLLEVLAARQDVLGRLAKLEETVAPAKRRWTDYLRELLPADRARAEELLAGTRTLLEQITAADRDDALILQQRKLNLGRELNQTRVAARVNRGYAANAYAAAGGRMDVQR